MMEQDDSKYSKGQSRPTVLSRWGLFHVQRRGLVAKLRTMNL